MKVLLVNGSPRQFGCTYTALSEVAATLNAEGVETELLWLGTAPVSGCLACKNCKKDGKCIIDDAVNDISARAAEFDGFIFGSPVYFAGPSGQIQSFMDRLFHGSRGIFRGKPAAAVVSCRRGGATFAFQRLNFYFQINSMPVVSSQYWNQVHGSTPDEVRQDVEGLQTMRTLARNMIHMLRSLQAGKDAGLNAPAYEKQIYTNFIR